MNDTKLKDILDYKFLSNLEISKGGDKLAYKMTKANCKDNKYDSNLFIYDLHSKENYQATDDNKSSIFTFDKDANLVYKKDSTDEKDTFFVKAGSGVGHKYFSLAKDVSSIKWLKDELFLVKASEKKSKEEQEKIKDESYFKEVTKLPFYFNGAGFLKDEQVAYYFYDKAKDELDLLVESDPTTNLTFCHINENLDKILFLKANNTPNGVMELVEDLVLFDVKEKKVETLISKEFSYSTARFIGNRIVFVATDMKKGGINEDALIYSCDYDGNYTLLSPSDFDMAFGNSIGTDARFGTSRTFEVANNKLYFVVTEFEDSPLYSIDLSGNITKEISSKVEDFVVAGDDIYYFSMDKDTLYELKATTSSEPLIENKVNTRVCPIETFDFESNGDNLKAYVILPKDFDENKKYPTLLSVHGGPKTELSDIFHHEHQMFANDGYIVIYTNPHGSSGRGVKFSDIRGKYGDIDYDDLMKFTDLALEKYPQIDSQKMGVYGGSYGGFMTNWIIGHTNRFRAACSQRSISNWTSFYGVSDIGYYFATDQTAGDIWEDFDKLWEQSPLKYAKNVTTPTLFIHSDEDYRCPLEQGIQMYARIKLNEVPTKMYIFHGENHELSRSGKPKGRIKRLEEIKSWFDKYLKDEN
ncbi:S9 family peptidase [uncultured Anaerococcus sp.]|uniref:alpha/beta hydrolase family protein n=1 Tax=uncultured Anaerococcus sp. TaxID=293428 RepID=UPI002889F26B|nr:S9 family peptidase [uncultured Anaerococcus sp.]